MHPDTVRTVRQLLNPNITVQKAYTHTHTRAMLLSNTQTTFDRLTTPAFQRLAWRWPPRHTGCFTLRWSPAHLLSGFNCVFTALFSCCANLIDAHTTSPVTKKARFALSFKQARACDYDIAKMRTWWQRERRGNNIRGRESFLAWRLRIFFSKAAASRDQKRCCLSSNRYSSDVGVCVCVSASWFMHKYACVCVCLGVFVISLIDISSSHAVWNAETQLPCRTNGIWTRVWVCIHTSWQWQIESFEVLNCISYTMLGTTAKKIHHSSHRYHQLLKQQKIEATSEENKQINKLKTHIACYLFFSRAFQ